MPDYMREGRSFQPLSSLKLPEWNPRLITEPAFKTLVASIQQRPGFLVRRPILVADGPKHKAGGIVHGGVQRARALEASFKQGWKPPPDLQEIGWLPGLYPVDVSDITEEEAMALGLIDNNHGGTYQEDLLSEMIAKLDEVGMDLMPLGFTAKRLEELKELSGINGETDEGTTNAPPADVDPSNKGAVNGTQATGIRQIVLYYPPDQFQEMLALMDWLRLNTGAETTTEAVTLALKSYQADRTAELAPA